jgi:hypothetical protein
VKAATAARHLSNAIRSGTVRYTSHAMEMIELADLNLPFVNRDLALAAARASAPDRNHRGRFVTHGNALIFVYEVIAPNVVIVTAFLKE